MGAVREAARADLASARRSIRIVRRGAVFTDVVLIFIAVPAILIGVELLIRLQGPFQPLSRDLFRFPVTEAGVNRWDLVGKAFLSSYGHRNAWPHLAGNLVWYAAASASLYALAVRIRRLGLARFVIAAALVCSPFIVAVATLANPVGGSTMGFSGSVATVLGGLPVMLFLTADRDSRVRVDPRWSAPPVFTVATVLALTGGLPSWVGLVTATSTVAITILLFVERGPRTVLRGLVPLVRYGNPFAMAGTVVAFAGAFLLFVAVTPETNVAGHLAGYGFGYLATLWVFIR